MCPGRQRAKLVPADEIVDILCNTPLVPDLPFESGDEVALMVNGLGGTPISELYLLYGIAHGKLPAKGINVFRSYVGEYCTSLEMAGAHVSCSRSTTSSSSSSWLLQRSPIACSRRCGSRRANPWGVPVAGARPGGTCTRHRPHVLVGAELKRRINHSALAGGFEREPIVAVRTSGGPVNPAR